MLRAGVGNLLTTLMLTCLPCFQWAYELGLSNEEPVSIPLHACEHFYVLTRPLKSPMESNMPSEVPSSFFT